MSQQEYSDDELLAQIRHCDETHDTCSPRVFNKMEDTASSSLVVRRFGSWSIAKQEAGIQDAEQQHIGREKQYSDEDVLRDLRECADRNDGRCTVKLLTNEQDLVSPSVAVDRFGSWADAKEEAGLSDGRTSNFRPREYTDEDYLELIRECEQRYGTVSQRLFDDDDSFPSSAAVRKRFGSWSDAKQEAGVDTYTAKYTDEELLSFLQDCDEKYGSVSASTFASKDEYPSPETLQRRFGSWDAAKQKAGVGKYSDDAD